MECSKYSEDVDKIAREIVDRKIDPFVGCKQISEICIENNFCDELLGFYHLDHLKTGHEQFGFFKDDLKEDVIKEAKNYLKFLSRN